MTRYVFILGLITTGVIISGFIPVLLPVAMTESLNILIGSLWSWNGILPIATFFSALAFYLLIEIAISVYKIFKWIVGS